ncbi:hypothetical protein HDV00_005626 [Rhizophlyctis rosea]|nr:hypothetical protein HDV00_005626 [Rhizophlyctis rosea]
MSNSIPVRVAVRVRPTTDHDLQHPRGARQVVQVNTAPPNDADLDNGEPISAAKRTHLMVDGRKKFNFDMVFGPDVGQEEVYEESVLPLVQRFIEGYNVTVLAYGQTGTGKTYTMGSARAFAGGGVEPYTIPAPYDGIIPRAILHIFRELHRLHPPSLTGGRPDSEWEITVSFLEIYNEDLIDLMVKKSPGSAPGTFGTTSIVPITIREDPTGQIVWSGAKELVAETPEEVLRHLLSGLEYRATNTTDMNKTSSRSHAIFALSLRQHRFIPNSPNSTEGDFQILTSKFNFVDLAGSERLKRTNAVGERAKEGIAINSGLLALGNVVGALAAGGGGGGDKHVPYRDSKLTRVLQDSLGGNSQTVMIATISPTAADLAETLNTLKWATRGRSIKNAAHVNQEYNSEVRALKEEVARLKGELDGKATTASTSTTTANLLTTLQLENTQLRTLLSHSQTSLSKLRTAHEILQNEMALLQGEAAMRIYAQSPTPSMMSDRWETESVGSVSELQTGRRGSIASEGFRPATPEGGGASGIPISVNRAISPFPPRESTARAASPNPSLSAPSSLPVPATTSSIPLPKRHTRPRAPTAIPTAAEMPKEALIEEYERMIRKLKFELREVTGSARRYLENVDEEHRARVESDAKVADLGREIEVGRKEVEILMRRVKQLEEERDEFRKVVVPEQEITLVSAPAAPPLLRTTTSETIFEAHGEIPDSTTIAPTPTHKRKHSLTTPTTADTDPNTLHSLLLHLETQLRAHQRTASNREEYISKLENEMKELNSMCAGYRKTVGELRERLVEGERRERRGEEYIRGLEMRVGGDAGPAGWRWDGGEEREEKGGAAEAWVRVGELEGEVERLRGELVSVRERGGKVEVVGGGGRCGDGGGVGGDAVQVGKVGVAGDNSGDKDVNHVGVVSSPTRSLKEELMVENTPRSVTDAVTTSNAHVPEGHPPPYSVSTNTNHPPTTSAVDTSSEPSTPITAISPPTTFDQLLTLRTTLSQTTTALESLQSEHRDLLSQITTIRTEHDTISAEKHKFAEELALLQDENTKLKERTEELVAVQAIYADLDVEVDEWKRRVGESEGVVKALEAKVLQIERERVQEVDELGGRLEAELEDLRVRLREKEEAVKRLEDSKIVESRKRSEDEERIKKRLSEVALNNIGDRRRSIQLDQAQSAATTALTTDAQKVQHLLAEARAECATLREEVRVSSAALAEAQRKAHGAEGDAVAVARDLDAIHAANVRLEVEPGIVVGSMRDVQGADRSVGELLGRVRGLEGDLEVGKRNAESLRGEIERLQGVLVEAEGTIGHLRDVVKGKEGVEAEVEGLRKEWDREMAVKLGEIVRLERIVADGDEGVRTLRGEVVRLEGEREALRRSLAQRGVEVERLKGEVGELRGRLEEGERGIREELEGVKGERDGLVVKVRELEDEVRRKCGFLLRLVFGTPRKDVCVGY